MGKKRTYYSSVSSEDSSFDKSCFNSPKYGKSSLENSTDSELSNLFGNKRFKVFSDTQDSQCNSSQNSRPCSDSDHFLSFPEFSQNLESFSSDSENDINWENKHSTPKKTKVQQLTHHSSDSSEFKINETITDKNLELSVNLDKDFELNVLSDSNLKCKSRTLQNKNVQSKDNSPNKPKGRRVRKHISKFRIKEEIDSSEELSEWLDKDFDLNLLSVRNGNEKTNECVRNTDQSIISDVNKNKESVSQIITIDRLNLSTELDLISSRVDLIENAQASPSLVNEHKKLDLSVIFDISACSDSSGCKNRNTCITTWETPNFSEDTLESLLRSSCSSEAKYVDDEDKSDECQKLDISIIFDTSGCSESSVSKNLNTCFAPHDLLLDCQQKQNFSEKRSETLLGPHCNPEDRFVHDKDIHHHHTSSTNYNALPLSSSPEKSQGLCNKSQEHLENLQHLDESDKSTVFEITSENSQKELGNLNNYNLINDNSNTFYVFDAPPELALTNDSTQPLNSEIVSLRPTNCIINNNSISFNKDDLVLHDMSFEYFENILPSISTQNLDKRLTKEEHRNENDATFCISQRHQLGLPYVTMVTHQLDMEEASVSFSFPQELNEPHDYLQLNEAVYDARVDSRNDNINITKEGNSTTRNKSQSKIEDKQNMKDVPGQFSVIPMTEQFQTFDVPVEIEPSIVLSGLSTEYSTETNQHTERSNCTARDKSLSLHTEPRIVNQIQHNDLPRPSSNILVTQHLLQEEENSLFLNVTEELYVLDENLSLNEDNLVEPLVLHVEPRVVSEVTIKKEMAKDNILKIIFKTVKRLVNGRSLIFEVPNSHIWQNCIFIDGILKLKPRGAARNKIINYENGLCRGKFCLLFYLLCKMYCLIINNSVCTQREVYYQLVAYLSHQSRIAAAIVDISCMLNIEPWFLPIVPTSKGLVYGDLIIEISSKEVIHCNAFGGTLIPPDITKIKKFHTNATFILIVEKDAVFKKLLDEDIPSKLTQPFIMITGKGYPDINTRLFVKTLSVKVGIPVYILVDADPHGIEIMTTYRFGSLAMCHVSEQLAIPEARWLGIFPTELVPLNVVNTPLLQEDRNKIDKMMERPYMDASLWLRDQLTTLLENNFKAEIEGLSKSNNYLSDFYLPYKFSCKDYL